MGAHPRLIPPGAATSIRAVSALVETRIICWDERVTICDQGIGSDPAQGFKPFCCLQARR